MATADRLSMLPDGILLDIISRLWKDEMVRTSVLSSRWRRLWTASPVFHFIRTFSVVCPKPEDHLTIVDHCLRQCSDPHKLRSVYFPLINKPGIAEAVDRWITFAADHDVEELALIPVSLGGYRVEVSPSLFYCSRLSALRLDNCLISCVPTASSGFPGFLYLRTLAFTISSISDVLLEALLSWCPCIERLTLNCVHQVTNLVIRSPAMRHLMVHDCMGLRRVNIVHAPELRRFLYSGDLSKIESFKVVAPKLEEAVMLSTARRALDSHQWRDLVSSIVHVRVLSVNSWFFQFTLGQESVFGDRQPKFVNLHQLHWWPVFKKTLGAPGKPWCAEGLSDSLHALVLFLRESPSLEQLCILCTYYMEKENDVLLFLSGCDFDDGSRSSNDNEDCDPLQEFKGVEYVLPRLKTVRMTEFSGKKEEMLLLEFLADKAVALETMNLHYVVQVLENGKLKKIRRQLRAFHRASPVARILISEFDEGKACPKHETLGYEFLLVYKSSLWC